MKSTVIDQIVNNDLCIGCGICAAICPQKNILVQFNNYGEYVATMNGNCASECGLCLGVCPFSDNNVNETDLGAEIFGNIKNIKFLPECGYYLDSYVGYSTKYRQTGASGGVATWLLTTLLENNYVDYVICVTHNKDPEKLFKFEIFDDILSISESPGSVYYPVEMSQVILRVLDKPGRYAIIGLPCFLKGLRLASQRNKKLHERIVVTIGLVCGQMKGKYYTTYLSELANAGGKLQKVYYRGKSPDKPASNYYFYCINERDAEGKIFWDSGVSEAWINRWFTPNACNFCDDVFAELADVTVMDAWLPEYSYDSNGANLVLVRSPIVKEMITRGVEYKELNAGKIPVEKVIQSQAGVIEVKRAKLPYRLFLTHNNGLKTPNKRLKMNNKFGFFDKMENKIKYQMQKESKNLFIKNFNGHSLNVEKFITQMKLLTNKLYLYRLIGKCVYFPKRKINEFFRRF